MVRVAFGLDNSNNNNNSSDMVTTEPPSPRAHTKHSSSSSRIKTHLLAQVVQVQADPRSIHVVAVLPADQKHPPAAVVLPILVPPEVAQIREGQ